ncbi:MAG: tetratricopeptide repeat protein [Candidatus Omnitrophica bacterium]|nr:tetratricopeptide repeat protein [Candidatus Omnitrophota bacterium]
MNNKRSYMVSAVFFISFMALLAGSIWAQQKYTSSDSVFNKDNEASADSLTMSNDPEKEAQKNLPIESDTAQTASQIQPVTWTQVQPEVGQAASTQNAIQPETKYQEITPKTDAGKKVAEETSAKDKLAEVISVSFKDTDLKQILSILADTYDLNILAGDDVKGPVTVNFKNVPLGDVLKQVLKLKNFTYIWEGNIIKVVSAEEVIDTRLFTLSHIPLDLATEVIADKLSKEGKSKMNTSTNQLIVTDTIARLDIIEKILDDIDIPPAQVRIETKLVDITHNDLDNIGVKWETTDLGIKMPWVGGSKAKMTKSDFSNPGSSTTLSGGQFVFGFAQGAATVTATIDALVEFKKARVIANPSITTLNNIEARINIGEKYPIREQTQTSTGTLETTRFVDVGTTLKVTPKINHDGTIQLVIHPEVSSVASALDAGPRITTREADTTVIVKDGETLVIAGLLQVEDDVNKSRVPILSSIPILGLLFSSQDKDKQQKELVIFMTPHILNKADKESYAEKTKVPSEFELVGERLNAVEIFNKAQDLERGETLQTRVFPVETRVAEAAREYQRCAQIYPDNFYADIALFRAGQIFENKLKNWPDALTCYQDIVENYPNSIYLGHAKKRLRKLMNKAEHLG